MENEIDYVRDLLLEKERLQLLSKSQKDNELERRNYRRHIIIGEEYETIVKYPEQTPLFMEKCKGIFEELTGRKMTEAEFILFDDLSYQKKLTHEVWGIKDFIIEVVNNG